MLEGQVLEGYWRRTRSSVVEQEIQPPERRLRLPEKSLDRLWVANIRRDGEHPPAQSRALGRGRVQGLRPATRHDDGKSISGECKCNRPPDPGATTGDHRNSGRRTHGYLLLVLFCVIA